MEATVLPTKEFFEQQLSSAKLQMEIGKEKYLKNLGIVEFVNEVLRRGIASPSVNEIVLREPLEE